MRQMTFCTKTKLRYAHERHNCETITVGRCELKEQISNLCQKPLQSDLDAETASVSAGSDKWEQR